MSPPEQLVGNEQSKAQGTEAIAVTVGKGQQADRKVTQCHTHALEDHTQQDGGLGGDDAAQVRTLEASEPL